MKILTIVGARPQFIKASPVSKAIMEICEDAEERIIHTGQHFDGDMSDIFFSQLKIPKPFVNLGIGGGTHGQNTGRMLEALESLFIQQNPDKILVYGDTDSTLAAGLAAAKLNIPVLHVEAGLRSYNKNMPEEINRIVVDHLSSHLYAPSLRAKDNLVREGIPQSKVNVVGDVMYDCIKLFSEYFEAPNFWNESERLQNENFGLCTIHRAENVDLADRLASLVRGLASIKTLLVMPLHPRTKNKLEQYNINLPKNIFPCSPVGYLEMQWLLNKCDFVITDSGGLQKDAYYHKKFCFTVRKETEWVELVDIGANVLTDLQIFSTPDIVPDIFSSSPYGNGDAAKLIAKHLSEI